MDESLEKLISDTHFYSKEISLLYNYLRNPGIITGTPVIKIKQIMAKLIKKKKHSRRVNTVEHLVIEIMAISLRTK